MGPHPPLHSGRRSRPLCARRAGSDVLQRADAAAMSGGEGVVSVAETSGGGGGRVTAHGERWMRGRARRRRMKGCWKRPRLRWTSETAAVVGFARMV